MGCVMMYRVMNENIKNKTWFQSDPLLDLNPSQTWWLWIRPDLDLNMDSVHPYL